MQTMAQLLPADLDEVAPWLSSDTGELILQLFEVRAPAATACLLALAAAHSRCCSLCTLPTICVLLALHAPHYMCAAGECCRIWVCIAKDKFQYLYTGQQSTLSRWSPHASMSEYI